jgi:hypothetical protein
VVRGHMQARNRRACQGYEIDKMSARVSPSPRMRCRQTMS